MKRPPYKLASQAPTEPRQNFVYMMIFGPTDSGKSTLAFTAPGPVCYFHSSGKVEGMLQRANIQHIRDHKFPIGEMNFAYLPPDRMRYKGHEYLNQIECAAAAKWLEFEMVFSEAFRWARTIIIDTDTALWQLIRFGFFGGDAPNHKYERQYKNVANNDLRALWGPVNSAWFMCMRQAVRCQLRGKTNVIVVTHAQDEYAADSGARKGAMEKKTGRLIPKSQKTMPYWAECSVQTRCQELSGNKYKYYATIIKPWDNESARGVELDVTGSDTSFEEILLEITGDADRWGEL